MYVAPSSTVKLYGGVQIIPGRQIAFSSKANQTAYFASKLVQSDTPCTYVRRTYSVKVEVAMSVVKNCNYISFVNPDFENITWYARITNYEYVNNACTEIFYAIDYFQTFMFDVNFEVCTMDREQLSVTDYDKSVANPYDYSIVELRTNENIPLPDDVFEYPAVIGQRSSNFDSKRTFLPGGGEDSSSEQKADTEMLYTIIMATPVTDITISRDSGTGVYVMTDADGTFSYENIKSLFNNAGFDGALVNPSSNLPIGNTVKATKYDGALAGVHDKFSWVMWDSVGDNYGYGSFGMFKNNVNNQTLILATNEYDRMQNILRVIAENDAVSSVVGCYSLPLSFITMLHAQSNIDALRTNFVELADSDRGPDYWNLEDSTYNWISVFKENITPIGFSEVQNKKLLTFPYQYIRVTSPNGLKKEFKFEDFTEFQGITASGLNPENQFVAKFTLLADITNTPLLELYPYLYKMYNNTTATYDHLSFRKKLNVEERVEFSDYPQQAFMTDAYLAYVSNQYSNQLLNEPMRENMKTQKYMYDNYEKWATKQDTYNVLGYVGDYLSVGGSALSGEGNMAAIGSSMKGMSSLVGKAEALNMKTAEYATNIQKNQAALNLRQEARNWANTGEIGTQLSAAKPAFRINDYKAGGGSGVLPYFLNGFKFTFDVMKLKSSFLTTFDEFFTNYGYKSCRTGVPHIATYLGGTKTGNAPKFLQNSQGYYVTYVKTVDCKVYSSMELITEFFEGLFDNGIQLIDGDTLLS